LLPTTPYLRSRQSTVSSLGPADPASPADPATHARRTTTRPPKPPLTSTETPENLAQGPSHLLSLSTRNAGHGRSATPAVNARFSISLPWDRHRLVTASPRSKGMSPSAPAESMGGAVPAQGGHRGSGEPRFRPHIPPMRRSPATSSAVTWKSPSARLRRGSCQSEPPLTTSPARSAAPESLRCQSGRFPGR